jgi:nucleotide-binding universal stress UspA family protein
MSIPTVGGSQDSEVVAVLRLRRGLKSLPLSACCHHDVAMSTSSHKETGLVVVGIDGSEESIDALSWAIEEAHIRGARVRALNVWNYPVGYGIEMAAINSFTPEMMEKSASTILNEAIDKALIGVQEPPMIERVSRQGVASKELLVEGKGADLLVVGQRGHGGFLGLLLGSVANQVLHHATCPTVVIPRRRATA